MTVPVDWSVVRRSDPLALYSKEMTLPLASRSFVRAMVSGSVHVCCTTPLVAPDPVAVTVNGAYEICADPRVVTAPLWVRPCGAVTLATRPCPS